LTYNKVKSDADPPHERHVNMPETMKLSVFTQTGMITITGETPFVDVVGTLNEDETFFATGRGIVAGFDDVVVAMDGAFLKIAGAVTLTAVYTMGFEGGLPSRVPIVFDTQGEKLEPGLDESMPEDVEPVQVFADSFGIAIQTGDTAFLYKRLHPVVPGLYGTDQCQSYLERVVDPSFAIDVVDVSRPGPWTWERDGHASPITYAYTATVTLSSQDYITTTVAHYAPDELGQQQWFTDCGDPLP
jgi:hypothetical protein